MKKQKNKNEKIYVKYKGTRFLLQPGHKVYECNTDTGLVREHPIRWAFTWPWQEGVTRQCTYNYNIIHLPAFNIDKAITEFKIKCRLIIEQRKQEGNPLIIHKAKVYPNEYSR